MIEASGYGHRLLRWDLWRLRVSGWLMKHGLDWISTLLTSTEERKTLQDYLEADLVLASGGTYLVPKYNLLRPFAEYELILALGKPLGFMPQSLGPFEGLRTEDRIRQTFRSAAFISVRDNQSRKHLMALGIPRELIRVVPDSAFALASTSDADPAKGSVPVQTTGMAERGDTPISRSTRPTTLAFTVAVSVRDWAHFENQEPDNGMDGYLKAVAGLIQWLVEQHRARVTLISSCQGIPEYHTDDSRVAGQVAARLPTQIAEHVEVDRGFRDPTDLKQALANYRFVVATRMHVAILALCAGVPVVPIAYEFKTQELFESMGLQKLVSPIDGITAEALITSVQSLIAEETRIRAVVRTESARLARETRTILPLLKAAVDGARAS